MFQGRPRSLTVHVATAFAAVLTVLAVSLVGFFHLSGRTLVLDAAEKLSRARIDLLTLTTEQFFQRIESTVRLIAADPALIDVETLDTEQILLRRAIDDLPDVDGVYIGYPTGAFFHLVSLDRNPSWRKVLSAPANASYATRVISIKDAGKPMSQWIFYAASGIRVGANPLTEATYDPRVRPWYKESLETKGVAWTPYYVFATTGEVGMTMSQSSQFNRKIVVGMDVTLEHLAQVLDRERLSDGTRVALFDRTGALIAFSGMTEAAFEEAASPLGAIVGAQLTESTDPVLRDTLKIAMTDASNRPGDPIVTVRPFKISDRELMIAMGVPVSELMESLMRHNRNALIMAALIAIASLPLIFFVAKLIARPLSELSVEAEKLKRFEFDTPITTKSVIKEVNRLADAMRSAKAGLATFGLYVPKALVHQVLDSGTPAKLGGEEREITVMFLDMAGFTTAAENRSPQEVMVMLSDLFNLTSEEVSTSGGCVDKFIGDGVMALWNAPLIVDDHALRACRCALAICRRIDSLNQSRSEGGFDPLGIRIGIHTGKAIVGNVGASDRLEYTALGDTVNIASRLEALNKEFQTRILVSGSVASRLAGRLSLRSVGHSPLKGRSGQLELFELL